MTDETTAALVARVTLPDGTTRHHPETFVLDPDGQLTLRSPEWIVAAYAAGHWASVQAVPAPDEACTWVLDGHKLAKRLAGTWVSHPGCVHLIDQLQKEIANREFDVTP